MYLFHTSPANAHPTPPITFNCPLTKHQFQVLGLAMIINAYPTSNKPHQTSNKPHPTDNEAYMKSNKPHPTDNKAYIKSNKPHQTSNKPYPISNKGQVTSNKPHPLSNKPHLFIHNFSLNTNNSLLN